MSDDNNPNKRPPPSYSGNVMPDNVSFTMDEGGEEPTRRIATMPSVQPSFEPIDTLAPPSLERSTQPTTSSKAATAPAAAPAPAKKAKTEPLVWKLTEVPPLPQVSFLERTAVLVPHTTPEIIGERISNVLRRRSIDAVYDTAKAKVKCIKDGVDFRVRCYRGRGEFNHGIIVEVQRRFGTSVGFFEDVQAILDAAQGKETKVAAESTAVLPLVSDSEDDYKADGASSLGLVAPLLDSTARDAQVLGLQMLVSLTGANRTGATTARRVSQELLADDNSVGVLVAKWIAVDTTSTSQDDSDDMLTYLAWTIVAQALTAANGRVSNTWRERLEPLVVRELQSTQARRAQRAAQCVEQLHLSESSQVYDALQVALETGTSRHEGLKLQAQRCLDQVGDAAAP